MLLTSAVLVIGLTQASCTPSVLLRAVSMAVLQEPQLMPPTLRRMEDTSPLPSSLALNPTPSTVLSSSSCTCQMLAGFNTEGHLI